MKDYADKDWLAEAEDEARGMQMLACAMALVAVLVLGALLGLAAADWADPPPSLAAAATEGQRAP